MSIYDNIILIFILEISELNLYIILEIDRLSILYIIVHMLQLKQNIILYTISFRRTEFIFFIITITLLFMSFLMSFIDISL